MKITSHSSGGGKVCYQHASISEDNLFALSDDRSPKGKKSTRKPVNKRGPNSLL